MEVFWSNDGVDASEKEKKWVQANTKKPTLVTREKASNPLREKMKSAVRKRNEQSQPQIPGALTSEECKVTQKQPTLKDLCPEDKQRVANLIKELARLGEEKENAVSQLAQQKAIYGEQIKALAKERDKMKLDREAVELQLKECQLLLDKYQKFLSEQQEKRSLANGNDVDKDLTKPALRVNENQTGVPMGIMQTQYNKPSHALPDEARTTVFGFIQTPDTQSNASNFSETHVTSSATSNTVLPRHSQSDHHLEERFSFQRPLAGVSGDTGHSLTLKEQAREPPAPRQPFLSDSMNAKKMPMTGPLNRPNLSSTRCSEYSMDDRAPMEMQFGSGNDRGISVPIVTNTRLSNQVATLSSAGEEIYRETDRRNPAAFLATQKMGGLADRMTLENRSAYDGVNGWPPLCDSQSKRLAEEEEAGEPFLLRRDPDGHLLQNEKSGFKVSLNSIPLADERETQGKVDSLNVGRKDHTEELLAQRKALLDEQRRLNKALLNQEAFFKKQEHELRLLQEAQHRSRFSAALEAQSSEIHEPKRDEEFRFTNRYENSSHSQKPTHLVNTNLFESWDQSFPRQVSAATSPVKLLSPRTEVDPKTDRAKISQSIASSSMTSSSMEESKTSARIRKSSKRPTEIEENAEGMRFQRILQTKQIHQPVRFSSGSSVSRSRVVRSNQEEDDNDSDSSAGDSKLIEDLFFVK